MNNAMTLARMPLPSPSSSLEAYIAAANREPMLSEEEEQSLARRFRDSGDLEAAKQLVMSHLRLVIAVARSYLGYGLPHADLIQEGNIGLMKAVRRFDPERGVRLVSFAMYWIKAVIHEYILRNWRLVKIATTKAQRKLFFNLRSMKSRLAGQSHHDSGFSGMTQQEVQTVAEQLGVSPGEVVEMETRLSGGDVALEPVGDYEDDSYAPIAYLAADVADEPSVRLERKQAEHLRSRGLSAALAGLDERSSDIIRRRWLAEQDQPTATLHELAAEYGVSAERIRQIEAKAMQKMKAALAITK